MKSYIIIFALAFATLESDAAYNPAINLSITNAEGYIFTNAQKPNLIFGAGIGTNLAYRILRYEDLLFLKEAAIERREVSSANSHPSVTNFPAIYKIDEPNTYIPSHSDEYFLIADLIHDLIATTNSSLIINDASTSNIVKELRQDPAYTNGLTNVNSLFAESPDPWYGYVNFAAEITSPSGILYSRAPMLKPIVDYAYRNIDVMNHMASLRHGHAKGKIIDHHEQTQTGLEYYTRYDIQSQKYVAVSRPINEHRKYDTTNSTSNINGIYYTKEYYFRKRTYTFDSIDGSYEGWEQSDKETIYDKQDCTIEFVFPSTNVYAVVGCAAAFLRFHYYHRNTVKEESEQTTKLGEGYWLYPVECLPVAKERNKLSFSFDPAEIIDKILLLRKESILYGPALADLIDQPPPLDHPGTIEYYAREYIQIHPIEVLVVPLVTWNARILKLGELPN